MKGVQMPRKKEPSSVTEKEVFPTRLRELMRERGATQRKLADAVGVRPQTISLYATGQSYPDVNGIRKIAEYFEVSADWLLGLTNTPTTEPYQRAAFDALGINYKAIRYLMVLNEIEKEKPQKSSGMARHTLLSNLLSEPMFDSMLSACCEYIDKLSQKISDDLFPDTPEYAMCVDILKEHGFDIISKEAQAAYLFNEKILLIFRSLLDEYAKEKQEKKEEE